MDDNAVAGENEISIRYTIKGSQPVKVDPFNITVRTSDAIIEVKDVKSSPEKIIPGMRANLSITLHNLADSLIKDIKVKLSLGDVPLAPIGMTNEITIKKLDANQQQNLIFYLAALPDAESSFYKVPLTINYQDELGNVYSKNNTIGIIIGDIPDLEVSLRSSTLVQPKTKGTITLQFVNKGVTGVKFLYTSLVPTGEYEIIGPSVAYIGKIDSDDYDTADFILYTDSSADVIIPLHIEYRDANNELYIRDEKITLPIYSSSEAKRFGLAKGNGIIGPIITIVIIVAGVLGYMQYRKKRKEKKA